MPRCWWLLQVNREGRGLPCWLSSKEPACNAGDTYSKPWVKNIPWRRKQQPTPVFLPGKSHGQRSLVGYHPWGCKESDMAGCLRHIYLTKLLHRSKPSSDLTSCAQLPLGTAPSHGPLVPLNNREACLISYLATTYFTLLFHSSH